MFVKLVMKIEHYPCATNPHGPFVVRGTVISLPRNAKNSKVQTCLSRNRILLTKIRQKEVPRSGQWFQKVRWVLSLLFIFRVDHWADFGSLNERACVMGERVWKDLNRRLIRLGAREFGIWINLQFG